jgi:transcriptional regulator with GAF, ATPase, and Fis domain
MRDKNKVLAMTDDQFREYILARLDAGQKTMGMLQTAIEENTRITQQNNEQTASIVSIMSFSEKSATRVVKFARFISLASKILLPPVVLYGAIKGIAAGHFPSLKDLL